MQQFTQHFYNTPYNLKPVKKLSDNEIIRMIIYDKASLVLV